LAVFSYVTDAALFDGKNVMFGRVQNQLQLPSQTSSLMWSRGTTRPTCRRWRNVYAALKWTDCSGVHVSCNTSAVNVYCLVVCVEVNSSPTAVQTWRTCRLWELSP